MICSEQCFTSSVDGPVCKISWFPSADLSTQVSPSPRGSTQHLYNLVMNFTVACDLRGRMYKACVGVLGTRRRHAGRVVTFQNSGPFCWNQASPQHLAPLIWTFAAFDIPNYPLCGMGIYFSIFLTVTSLWFNQLCSALFPLTPECTRSWVQRARTHTRRQGNTDSNRTNSPIHPVLWC